jgi:hypothetical protein
MILTQVTAPSELAALGTYSVTQFKQNKRIVHALENDRIESAISDAYAWFDGPNGWLRRALITQTWKMELAEFSDEIEIPLPPLQALLKVQYYDEDNVLTDLYDVTVSPEVTSDVFIVVGGLCSKLVLAYDEEWPVTYERPDAVRITFRAGYGDAGTDVPRPICRSIGMLATHLYENPSQTYPEPRLVEVPREIHWGIKQLAGRFRIMNDYD